MFFKLLKHWTCTSNLSTIVSMVVLPAEGGRVVTKSKPPDEERLRQDRQGAQQSSRGHQNLSLMKFSVWCHHAGWGENSPGLGLLNFRGREAGEGIRLHISGAGVVGQEKLQTPEEERPAGLTRVQPLALAEIGQALMIGLDYECVFCSLQPVSPLL